MKLYVGSGDKGKTSLLSGERVPKSDPRIEACGEVDELVSVIGALIASLGEAQSRCARELTGFQSDLLAIGAILAATPGSPAAGMLPPFGPEKTRAVEEAVDRQEKTLPPLQGFLLPGGHPSAAWAHVARTVCRRAERRVIALADSVPGAAEHYAGALSFLNRLSDCLYVTARACNAAHGVAESRWKP
jgi:cob(I)alamin adenosyltransferase